MRSYYRYAPYPTVWRPGFFYAMHREFDGAIKFGISVQPEVRRQQIERERRHGSVSLLWTHKTQCMRGLELRVHKALSEWRVDTEKEWFSVSTEYADTLLEYLGRGCNG